MGIGLKLEKLIKERETNVNELAQKNRSSSYNYLLYD